MAHAAGDAHEYPMYGAHFRVVFPILDADGDLVTGATGLDSERSIDCGTFADCTNEATEIATASGLYYLDLTGAEMTGSVITIIVKTTSSGAKTTPITLYPKRTSTLESGTAQAGAASTITLASGASAKDGLYNGMYVHITNNSPAGAQYQIRRITDYVGSTRVATVESAWGTNPSSASTYDIVVPETVGIAAWGGTRIAEPTVLGVPEVDITHYLGSAAPALVGGRIDANVGAISSDVTAADNLESWFDNTGYIASNSSIGNVIGDVNANVATIDTAALSIMRSIFMGTADSGTTTTLVDSALIEADTDYWKGNLILFTSGNITGQIRLITGFNPATDTITFSPATTQAVGTNTYEILPFGRVDLNSWLGTTAATPNTAGVPVVDDRTVIRVGTCQGSTTSLNITLDASASGQSGYYAGNVITIVSGTAAGQSRVITGYNGLTKVVTLSQALETQPDSASVFVITPASVNLASWIREVPSSLLTGHVLTHVMSMNNNTITSAVLADGALGSIFTGTADSGTTTTMVDAALTQADTDYWKGNYIVFTSGSIAGQVRLITGFNPGTDTITFSPATTQAVGTNVYEILPAGRVDVNSWLGADAATPSVAGVPEVDITHWGGSAPSALISGRVDASVGAAQANTITDASVSTDMDAYHAKVWVVKESTTTDHYAVVFFKNGQPITSGITSPTIQVIKASDGTDLIASTALTEVGSLGIYKKDEGTNKLAGGAIYFAKVTATIDGSSRTWFQQIGRDST